MHRLTVEFSADGYYVSIVSTKRVVIPRVDESSWTVWIAAADLVACVGDITKAVWVVSELPCDKSLMVGLVKQIRNRKMSARCS